MGDALSPRAPSDTRTLVAVAPDKYARGFDGGTRAAADAYEVVELGAALRRTYLTDAHLVTYVVRGAASQPRINKLGLPHFPGVVETTVFFCDVDNANHAAWNDDLVARARAEYETLDVLQTCGVYHTAHGRRIMQPLAEPIAASRAEPYLRRWLLSLEAAGLSVDWACRDWTRHFRLPHVMRSRRPYRSPLVLTDRMRAIPLEPISDEPPVEPPPARTRRVQAPLRWTSTLPAQWEARAVTIAKAIRDTVTADWHAMYLALGGALLSRQMPPEHLPAIIEWIAMGAGSAKPWSHARSAKDTAENYAAGRPTTGLPSLRAGWSAVAQALEEVTASHAEARLREQARSAPTPPPLADATRALEEAVRHAPDGLTVISAECGIGKTRAAMRVAAERADKTGASGTQGTRAPLGSKTSISVDKSALAIQVAEGLRAMGTPVRRLFGPLSVLRDDGTPECRFADAARPLVDGGQPMQWELCQGRGVERCEFYASCGARGGVEGPDDARVTVAPHALLRELDAAAGATGLLVIDEPPAVLETVMLSREDLHAAQTHLHAFEGQYAAAMAPALEGFRVWLDIAEDGALSTPQAALEQARPAPDAWAYAAASTKPTSDVVADAIACAARALREDRRSQAPPIQRSYIFAAKRSVKLANELGAASKVLGTIRRVLMEKTPVAVRAEHRGLLFTAARPDVEAALRRDGAVVVTDANADVHLPVYEKLLGYPPKVHRFSAADGAPIERTLVRCRTATRKAWFVHGVLVVDAVTPALRAAIEWARTRAEARRLGLITVHILRAALEVAWTGKPNADVPSALVAEAQAKLLPILRTWPGEITFGHYGAVRGLDSMAEVDALVTLGDPWPNVGDVKSDAAFLGLPDWGARLEALCRAELEQAHGRIRAVHRKRPGSALHVGQVLPSGHGWTSGAVRMRGMPPGPPRAPSAAVSTADVARLVASLGGVRASASTLGVSVGAVSNYVAGRRSPPPSFVDALVARADHVQASCAVHA